MTQLGDIYVVLGMARSGTSAITRGLKVLGIDLGQFVDKKNKNWNAKGFWEDLEIVYNINRAILTLIGYTHPDIRIIESLENQASLRGFKILAQNLLVKRFISTKKWGFKDPRTALVLSFWQSVFKQLNLNENYIITLRNPLACAYSYHRLMKTEIETGLLLWLAHLVPAINLTRNKKRVIVNYDAMMQNPLQQLERMHKALQLDCPLDKSSLDIYVNEFLDEKLKHFDYNDIDLKEHPATLAVPLCGKIYNLLQQAATDEISLNSNHFSDQWEQLMQEFQVSYPMYCYINTLLKRNKHLEREIKTIRRSIPWKMIFPLRKIDDVLRALRRNKKERKKINETSL